jgi:hypothetical protein
MVSTVATPSLPSLLNQDLSYKFREHVNTLLVQTVLDTPAFHDRMGADERRGLSPLFWTHINPYGRFRLDMNTSLDLTAP